MKGNKLKLDNFKLRTPVVFVIFNRLDTTKKVFEKIRKIQPKSLFIICDGPRKNKPNEINKVEKVKQFVERNINWNCKVYKNYSNVNLGCKKRISSGLDWVFNHVEKAIILEDDCLPSLSFFKYCQELLDLYEYDKRIMMISGDNLINYKVKGDYTFSTCTPMWGWATWKRAWNFYDVDMKIWPTVRREKTLLPIFNNIAVYKYYLSIFNSVYNGKIDSWAYPWFFAQLINSGLSIIPNKNMIKNIGFNRKDATHTTGYSKYGNLGLLEMGFPIKKEKFVLRNYKHDDLFYNYVCCYDRKLFKLYNFLRMQ